MKHLLPLVLLLLGAQAEAAITFRASDTTDNGSNAAQGCTVDKPAGTVQNDVMLFYVSVVDGVVDVTNISSPGGVTEIYEFTETAGQDRRLLWAYKVAGPSEGTTYVFTGDAGANERWECGVATFDGVHADVLDVTFASGSHYHQIENTAHIQDPPSITTNTDGAWVLTMQWISHDDVTAASPSSGYTTRDVIIFDGAVIHRNWYLQSKEVTTAGVENPDALTHTENGTGVNDGSLIVIALKLEGTVLPEFSSGPTVSPTANGYTIGGTVTCTGICTTWAVASPPVVTGPPSCSQIKNNQDGSGSTAAIYNSEVWTNGQANSFPLTLSGSLPRYDVYVCASDGTNNTTVSTFENQNRTANSGKSITVLDSVSSTSVFALATDSAGDTTNLSPVIANMADTSDFLVGMLVDVTAGFPDLTDLLVVAKTVSSLTPEINSNNTVPNITVTADVYFNPAIAAGDVIEGSTTAVCTAGSDAVTWETDGDFSYTATTCGTTLTTIDYCVEDITATTGLTTTPGNCFTAYDKIYLFNSPPDWSGMEVFDHILIWDEDVALSGVTMTDFCADVNAHALSFTAYTAFVPGVIMNSGGAVTGAPTTENEAGTTINILCRDSGLLSAKQSFTQYVVNTYTAPNCTNGDTVAECKTEWDTAAPWYGDSSDYTLATFACSETVAENDVISQTPVQATEVDNPLQPIVLVVSLGETTPGCIPPINSGKVSIEKLNLGLGL
jgi:hypothetical protein